MPLFTKKEREVARAIGALSFTNPFLPERIDLERQVLGDDYIHIHETWSADPNLIGDNPNVKRIRDHAAQLSSKAREALIGGAGPVSDELQVYEELCLYEIY